MVDAQQRLTLQRVVAQPTGAGEGEGLVEVALRCLRSLLAALEARCTGQSIGRGELWVKAASRRWYDEGGGAGEEEFGEWLLTLQGAFLGLADTLANVLFLDGGAAVKHIKGETETEVSPGTALSVGGGGEDTEGASRVSAHLETSEGNLAESGSRILRQILRGGGVELVTRAVDVCTQIEAAVRAEMPGTPGEGAVWWVKGHTTFDQGSEGSLEIGHCSASARETMFLLLRLFSLASSPARVPAAPVAVADLSAGEAKTRECGCECPAKEAEETCWMLAEVLRERGNAKMQSAQDYRAALVFYSIGLLLLVPRLDVLDAGDVSQELKGKERALAVGLSVQARASLALLLGNRSEVLLRLGRASEAERDAIAAIALDQPPSLDEAPPPEAAAAAAAARRGKNGRRLERARDMLHASLKALK